MSAPVDVLAVRYLVGDTLAGNEFAAVSTGELLSLPVFMEISGDTVLGGRHQYKDGGWKWIGPCPRRPVPADPKNLDAPECSAACRWVVTFKGFDLQRNAIRTETASLVQPERCGWNLLTGRIGGHPLDYAPCSSSALARVKGA